MTEATSIAWNVGEVILDQYEITGILGQGGMGTVYRVLHRGWNVDLAMKTPNADVLSKEGGKANFVREAETWVKLTLHPNIVNCYYVRPINEFLCVFAEYVSGGSLSSWIRSRRLYAGEPKQAMQRMLDIAIQFAWGLHAAHEQGLVHQDVKPANVMLTPDGIAKVTDFGLAKARAMAGNAPTPLLDAGQSILVSYGGMTEAYCSPEQAARRPLSRKTDLWSWAVSVLEIFTGGVTWKSGVVAGEALADYLQQGAEDQRIPTIPTGLADLLRQCFQPQPDKRPTDMAEVATALQEIYQQEVGQTYPHQMPKPAEALAATLNNRALSLYDLGKVEEARQIWEQALKADPLHLEATYNQGLILWRQAELTDDVLVQRLETVRASKGKRWRALSLLAQVHLERADVEAALPLLREVSQLAPGETEEGLIESIQSGALPSHRPAHTFQGHTDTMVRSVCLSTDGRLALSLSSDLTLQGNILQVWEVTSGRCLRTFQGMRGMDSMSLSADGSLALFGGGEDHTLQLWEVTTGRLVRTFQGHTNSVASVNLSADGRLALSGSKDNTLRLWEVATGRCLHTLQSHTDGAETRGVRGCLSADGRVALSTNGNTLQVWEVATGYCLRVFQGMGRVRSISLSADGSLALFVGGVDHTLQLWEVATGRLVRTFQGHTNSVTSVSLSADGRLALSGSEDRTLRLWEVATGRCLHTFYKPGVYKVVLSADGRLALSAGLGQTIQLWDLAGVPRFCSLHPSPPLSYMDVSNIKVRAESLFQQAEQAYNKSQFARALDLVRTVRTLPGYEYAPKSRQAWEKLAPHCSRHEFRGLWRASIFKETKKGSYLVTLSADGLLALSGSKDNTLRLWEVATGRCLRTFQGHTNSVLSIAFSVDGRLALSGSLDHTLRLWEVTTGRCLRVFQGHTNGMGLNGVRSVSLSADGRLALSGGSDRTLRLWEVTTGRCLRVFQGHIDSVTSVSLSADGRLALSGSRDRTMRLWEVATGHCLRVFQGHTNGVSLSADGLLALSGSEDNTLRLWEVTTGRCLHTLQGHIDMIMAVSLSADGRLALSGSLDHTLRLWEVTTGRCLHTFYGHTDRVDSVSLSADGRLILSGSWNQTIRLWELDWELEARNPDDWDEEVLPYLETFLSMQTPYTRSLPRKHKPSKQEIQQALTRRGKPTWNESDFKELIRRLRDGGYSWLRPENVRRQLEERARSWKGPAQVNAEAEEPHVQRERAAELLKLVKIYCHPGDHEVALAAIEQALALDPQNATAWFDKGKTLADLRRLEEAQAAFGQALSLDPQMIDAWFHRGLVLFQQEQYTKALTHFDKTLSLDPQNSLAYSNRGAAYHQLRQYQQALRDHDQALALDPQNASVWLNKGITLSALRQHKKALTAYKQVLKLDPENTAAWFVKGEILLKLRRTEEALLAFAQALVLNDAPDKNDALWKNIGCTFMLLGLHEKAVEAFEWALALDPNDGVVWYNKGLTLCRIGRYEEATEAFGWVLDLDPQFDREPAFIRILKSMRYNDEDIRQILPNTRRLAILHDLFLRKKKARVLAYPATTVILHKLAQLNTHE